MKAINTLIFTLVALFAFAANSVLCRLALYQEQVDPALFSAIRIASAATILALILVSTQGPILKKISNHGSWPGAVCLLTYIIGFSYAYITLDTATGALILFACVQFTMLFVGWRKGKVLTILEKLGVFLALVGFIYFVYPELSQPSLIGCVLMAIAGIAWGGYSLLGAGSQSPLNDTASNFTRITPLAITVIVAIYLMKELNITQAGLIYTVLSGAIASGLGYALWYYVLPKLPSSIAAVSQLSVPIWAAFGGVLFVSEPISLHLMVSSLFILGGILLVVIVKSKR